MAKAAYWALTDAEARKCGELIQTGTENMIYFSDILNTVLPMLLAFAISTVTGHFLIPQLRRLKIQQTERGEGPQSHLGKSGTPNMGGLMIIAAVTVTGLFSI